MPRSKSSRPNGFHCFVELSNLILFEAPANRPLFPVLHFLPQISRAASKPDMIFCNQVFSLLKGVNILEGKLGELTRVRTSGGFWCRCLSISGVGSRNDVCMAELQSLTEIFARRVALKYLLLHMMEAFGCFQNALDDVGQPLS